MRFAQYASHGPPSVLEVVERDEPALEPGRVLVEIRAAGVNPFDVKQRAGLYAAGPLAAPARTGFDGAGVVAAVGADVEGWLVGTSVITRSTLGTAGTHLAVKASNLIRVPDGVDLARAASIGTPVGTAFQALRSLAVADGDVLIVHGGSGAVGQAAIQLARTFGADRVLATAGPRNLDRLAEIGAEPIAYGPGVLDRIREALAGERTTAILDAAGTDDAFASAELLVDRSRWATIVAGARADESGLTAFSGGSRVPLTAEQNALRREGIAAGLAGLADGTLDVELGASFPLDEIAAAHAAVEARTTRGKVIVRP